MTRALIWGLVLIVSGLVLDVYLILADNHERFAHQLAASLVAVGAFLLMATWTLRRRDRD